MFTILLVTNNADITSSKLSRILRTKLAFFSPFFNFKSILALFVLSELFQNQKGMLIKQLIKINK